MADIVNPIPSDIMHPNSLVDQEDGGKRRSTRASALKAQEKIKNNDGIESSVPNGKSATEFDDEEEEDVEENNVDEVAVKKRKLDSGASLDQYSHTFYIQAEKNGDVCEVSEESDISSLNSEDVSHLKFEYDKNVNKELSAEQKIERHRMIKECQAVLRQEEAKLMVMKKINNSQLIARQKLSDIRLLANKYGPGTSNMAYKATSAIPRLSTSGASTSGANKTNNGVMTQQYEKLLGLLRTNPQVGAQLLKMIQSGGMTPEIQKQFLACISQLADQQSKNQEKLQKEEKLRQQIKIRDQLLKDQKMKEQLLKDQRLKELQKAHELLKQRNAQQSMANKMMSAMTTKQKEETMRKTIRTQVDKALGEYCIPKQRLVDPIFVPNPTSDFCCMLGLDSIVERLTTGVNFSDSVKEKPYECEECKTDFTPVWKATGSGADMHLYCEKCVDKAIKRRFQRSHTSNLRNIFTKIDDQVKKADADIKKAALSSASTSATPTTAAATSSTTVAAPSKPKPPPVVQKPTPPQPQLQRQPTIPPNVASQLHPLQAAMLKQMMAYGLLKANGKQS